MNKKKSNILNNVRLAFRALCGATNASNDIMLVQLKALDSETINDAEVYQQFGFTSNLPKNTTCIALPLGGKTSHSVCIATENGEFRVKGLPRGAVCVYDEKGSAITLNNDGTITTQCETHIIDANVIINGNTQINNKLSVTDDIISEKDVKASGISVKNHTHDGVEKGKYSTKKPTA